MPDKIRVLLVDDHEMFIQPLVLLLEREDDLEVVGTAGTGAQGIEQAMKHSPDVVLMDFQLPDTDGARACAAIKTARPETKVIVLTGLSEDDALVASIEAGCSGFLTKDRGPTELVQSVRAAHKGEALINPAILARLLPKLRRGWQGVGTDLTAREKEVLEMLAEGLPNKAIAERMAISVHTVRNYVQAILTKLHAHSKLEAVSTAVREGLIKYPA